MTRVFSKLRRAVGAALRGVGNLLHGGAGGSREGMSPRRAAGARQAGTALRGAGNILKGKDGGIAGAARRGAPAQAALVLGLGLAALAGLEGCATIVTTPNANGVTGGTSVRTVPANELGFSPRYNDYAFEVRSEGNSNTSADVVLENALLRATWYASRLGKTCFMVVDKDESVSTSYHSVSNNITALSGMGALPTTTTTTAASKHTVALACVALNEDEVPEGAKYYLVATRAAEADSWFEGSRRSSDAMYKARVGLALGLGLGLPLLLTAGVLLLLFSL